MKRSSESSAPIGQRSDPAVVADGRWVMWRRRPDRAGVLVDFDGTLSAIVTDPRAARPLPEAAPILEALAARYHTVAVISGRPVVFLAKHLAARGVLLSGLYGLESWWNGQTIVDGAAESWRAVVARAAEQAEHDAPPGVLIERKGLSVTLHVRVARGEDEWVRTWARDAAARTGLTLHEARKSYELRPPVDADKGTVVESLVASLVAVCFVGDDRGDLPAFAALDRLTAADPDAVTLRVAVSSEESPPELLDAADLVVDGPDGALALLGALAGQSAPSVG